MTAKLRSGHSQFVITDSTASYGTIPTGETRSNDADRFAATAHAAIPRGTKVPCTLMVHSDNWAHDWTFTFLLPVGLPPLPGQYIATLDTGAVSLSVCAIGSIGYDEPPGDGGAGFQVPKGTASCLFFGGMMAGNSEDYLVDHFYGHSAQGGTNKDWQMADSFRVVRPGTPADEYWVSTMDDAGHSSPKGLNVEQHWYMNAAGGYRNWAIGAFDFTNTGPDAINGLHAGMVGDFDAGLSPTADIVGSDSARRAVWLRQASGENPCAGLVLLEPKRFANLTAVDHALYVYPDSAMTDGMKWRLLNGTVTQRQSNREYNWSVLASAGPFDLAPGAKKRAAFAVVGATSLADWVAAAESAQSWYDANLLGVEEGRPVNAAAGQPLLVAPNPLVSGFATLRYSLPRPGPMAVAVYDALGRPVLSRTYRGERGASSVALDLRGLAGGVYLVRLRADGYSQTRKLVVHPAASAEAAGRREERR